MPFVEKVKKTIKADQLLQSGDRVLVALSGGPDSVALLNLLADLRDNYDLNLFALYVNHNIRPKAAKTETVFCRNLCRKLGAEFSVIETDIPKLSRQVHKGIEETAREFRYEQFEKTATALKCNKIALGHHIDDRIETALFRILRGTGRTGLKGIPIRRGKYVRPLFDVSKAEILDYLKKNRIKYCTDQSNLKSEYTRNFIRNELLPLIRKKINKNVDQAILNLLENVSLEEEFLEGIVQKEFDKVVSARTLGKLVLALKKFDDYDLWLQKRLIRRCIVNVSGSDQSPDKITVENVLELAHGKNTAVTIPNGVQCTRTKDALFFVKRINREFNAKLPLYGKTYVDSLGYLKAKTIAGVTKNGFSKARKSSKVIVDLDKVAKPLLVRSIANGDRFQPLGLSGRKKVGDYLTDRKVNVLTRDEIPVVADRKGIIWLVGFEIDERVKIDKNTKKVLELEFTPVSKA